MQSRGSNHRLSSMSNNRSRIPALLISMFATFATIYVAGRFSLKFSRAISLFLISFQLIILNFPLQAMAGRTESCLSYQRAR